MGTAEPDRPPAHPPPPPSWRKPGPAAARPALLTFALVLWAGLYAAAAGRGPGALLLAQMASFLGVWYILKQAPAPGRLLPRRSWRHAASYGTASGLGLAIFVLIIPGGRAGGAELLPQTSGLDLLLTLGVIVVGAPLAEEMLFRQGIQRQLELARGAGWSIIISSALFVAAHPETATSAEGAAVLGAAGVMLAQLRRRTGLPGAVIGHSIYNLAILAFAAM